MDGNGHDDAPVVCFEITGRAAHGRIAPLLPLHWIDVSPYAAGSTTRTCTVDAVSNDEPHFLWENAPRHETKPYRDAVACYSHLPNGRAVLDDKWVLARLMGDKSSSLESHCFRGLDGFLSFCNRVEMHNDTTSNNRSDPSKEYIFPDLLLLNKDDSSSPVNSPPPPKNWWVVKDAGSNGAGGIWVVGPENAHRFSKLPTSPLLEQHRYVAQRYAWPLVLYGGRKFHVRVYGLLTSDNNTAYVHKRAFLHVANEPFEHHAQQDFKDSVHITNCCANSHDESKFAGEICADFGDTHDEEGVVSLADFFPSVRDSVAALAQAAFPFLKGGQANGGFEYLGMDFILSYRDGKPMAYLLEVNAPPSQDTATGLEHAEDLHNQVLQDLVNLVVLPKVSSAKGKLGGWRCVYRENLDDDDNENEKSMTMEKESTIMIVPSKAAILNKIRLAIFERKASKLVEEKSIPSITSSSDSDDASAHGKNKSETRKDGGLTAFAVAEYARSRFPYFVHDSCSSSSSWTRRDQPIFFENAGGSQVPYPVINAVASSLSHRHRCVVGATQKKRARQALLSLVGGSNEEHDLFLGPNASVLFHVLARRYVEHGLLKRNDEIVISTENHLANIQPWIEVAKVVGAKIKWWRSTTKNSFFHTTEEGNDVVSSCNLKELLTPRTRVVALVHSSNILGQLRNLAKTRRLIKELTRGYAHIVADGVSAAPHVFASVTELGVDWYGVSCHKLFGPHLGGLCGKKSITREWIKEKNNADDLYKLLEIGTISYEACAGVLGIAEYLRDLATFDGSGSISASQQDRQTRNQSSEPQCDKHEDTIGSRDGKSAAAAFSDVTLSATHVKEAFRRIRIVEEPLVTLLLQRLRSCDKVTVVESDFLEALMRLPVVGFVHQNISSSTIVRECSEHGIACRHGTFLCSNLLKQEFCFDFKRQQQQGERSSTSEKAYTARDEGLVRISFAHYNTIHEVEYMMEKLEAIPSWW